MAASSGSGGMSSEPPAQTAPSERAKFCAGGIAGAGEGIDAPALPGRDLGQNMGGGAEAVEAERRPLPGHAVTAPADQAGAQERRRLRGIDGFRQRKAEARVGDRVRRVAAVAGIAGEQRISRTNSRARNGNRDRRRRSRRATARRRARRA